MHEPVLRIVLSPICSLQYARADALKRHGSWPENTARHGPDA